MIRKECSIRFYLKKPKTPRDKYPIFCRIIYERKKVEFSVGHRLEESKWDDVRGLPKRDPELREYLTKIESKILENKRKMEFEGKVITSQILKDSVKPKKTHGNKAYTYFDQAVQKYAKLKNEYSKATIKKYLVAKNLLQSYLSHIDKSPTLDRIDYNFISNWDIYMITCPEEMGKTRARNTVNSYHKRFKKVLGDAVKEGLITINPYIHFQIKDQKVEREALLMSEIRKMKDLDLSHNERLDIARDLFLFTCFSGIRFQDGQDLTSSNIYEDDNGIRWMKYKQSKVDRSVDFPLLAAALEIVQKYDEVRSITGFILPRLSNQKTNQYLKEIAELTGITKRLTHHIAKHSFATTILRENKIPHEVIKEWLGHSMNHDITLLYAKLSRDNKLDYKKQLDSILSKIL